MARILVQEGAIPWVSGIFQGGSTGGSIIRVVDVGSETLHGTGSRKFSAQGYQAGYGEESKEIGGWGLGVPTTGYSDGGGGV